MLIDALSNDPFQPHLKLHPLKGRLEGLYAVRLTFSYRITLTLQLSEHAITLLDIGSHDNVEAFIEAVHALSSSTLSV